MDLSCCDPKIRNIFTSKAVETCRKKEELLKIQISCFKFLEKICAFLNKIEFLDILPGLATLSISSINAEIRTKNDFLVSSIEYFEKFLEKFLEVNREEIAGFSALMKK